MNTDTAGNPVNIVVDTNVIISAIGFGGKPREILQLIFDRKVNAVTSAVLLAELEDVIFKKFPKLVSEFEMINNQIRKNFIIVKPSSSMHILKDEPDNRVLEAAIEGSCQYIVTGDKGLLDLTVFKTIHILPPAKFISTI